MRMTLPAIGERPKASEIHAVFSPHSARLSWLEVEATLAEAQADLGIIPVEAAKEIRAKANFDVIDEAALVRDIERTRAPIVSLTRALSAACAGDAGGYVHWGATTQNVMQTGQALLMKRAHSAFLQRFDDCLIAFTEIADREAGTLTVSRTNHRQALPITFGFKSAGWIEEWLRHRERLQQAAPRVFRAQWGGTVGAMHAVGALGPALNQRLAERLGLGHFDVPSRSALDGFAEYVLVLGMFAATCGKIARSLYALMSDEIDEVAEDQGEDVVGSSTMPHKVNPKSVVGLIARAGRLRALVPEALEAMQPLHEGDAACNLSISRVIETACPLAYELAAEMAQFIAGLRLRPEKMRANLDSSGGFLLSERIMMQLAPIIGRNRAHDLVHEAVARAIEKGMSLEEALAAEGAGSLVPSMRELLDPAGYVGLSAALAHKMANTARLALAGSPGAPRTRSKRVRAPKRRSA
jgi:3-carboxy-cis,cis-muconate cycloisomerase